MMVRVKTGVLAGFMSSFRVFRQAFGEFATNAYLLQENGHAIAFDAPPGAFKFYQSLLKEYGVSLEALILTHSHFDHIADAKKIQDSGVKVGIHAADRGNCEKPGSDQLPLMIPVDPFQPNFTFKEGPLTVGSFQLTVLETPGHTPGGCCFIYQELLFSGDTLFRGSIGNLSLPTSNRDLMRRSLEKLSALKRDFTVYPGHGPETTLDREKPYLKQLISYLG